MFKKGFSAILIVVVVLVVIGGGVLTWQYWPEDVAEKQQLTEQKEIAAQKLAKTEQPIIEEEIVVDEVINETANWKTYQNKKYGFKIKYPQNWGLEILSDVSSPYTEGIDIIQPYNEIYKQGSFVGKDLKFLMILSSSVNLDNIIKNNKAEEINLGNVTAWRYKRQIEGPETMVLIEEVTLISDKDFYIEISELANYGPKDYSYRSRTINTILSTFKFVEQKVNSETADWQTYRNEEYGFEVKYPKNYLISETTITTEQAKDRLFSVGFTNEKYNLLDGPVPPHIVVSVLKDASDQDINEWLLVNSTEAEFATEEHEQSKKRYYNFGQMNIRSRKIGLYDGLEFDLVGGYPCNFGYALLKNRNLVFELFFMCKGNQEEANNFNKMLTTFKFVD